MTLVIAFNVYGKLTADKDPKHFAYITKQHGSSSSGSTTYNLEMSEPANFAATKCFFVVENRGERKDWHTAILAFTIKVKNEDKFDKKL